MCSWTDREENAQEELVQGLKLARTRAEAWTGWAQKSMNRRVLICFNQAQSTISQTST